MSPHPRYNSRTLAFLSRQFGSLRDRTQELVRHTKMVARWTAEAALYPFAQFIHQTQKTLGQGVKSKCKTVVRTFNPAKSQQAALGNKGDSSTPILRILDAIELVQSPCQTQDLARAHSTRISLTIQPQKGALAVVSQRVKALRRKIQRFLLSPTLQALEKVPELSATEMPNGEQTLNRGQRNLPSTGILAWLKRKIIQPISDQALVVTPTSESTPSHAFADRPQPSTLTWFKRKIIQPISDQALVVTPTSENTLSHAFTDRPQQVLLNWVRQGVRILQKVQHFCFDELSSSRSLEISSGLTHSAQLTQSDNRSLLIQGVASLLDSKSIVLVTSEQEILDILSPAQQSHLYQRMMQELSRFNWQRRQASVIGKVAQLFGRISFSRSTPVVQTLPNSSPAISKPIRFWGKMKTRMIHSVIGALAALPIVAIPAIAAENSFPQSSPSPQPVSSLWIDPNHLKIPVALEELYGLISGQVQGQRSLRIFPKNPEASTQVLGYGSQNNINHSPRAQDDYHTEILIDAEFLGYESHLLEDVLSWIDVLIVKLETGFAIVWTWIGMVVVLCLSGWQKIRQLIPD